MEMQDYEHSVQANQVLDWIGEQYPDLIVSGFCWTKRHRNRPEKLLMF